MRLLVSFAMTMLLSLPSFAADNHPAPAAATILVDDFETGTTQGLFAERKNRLDAFQGTWARRPSYTVITKVDDTKPGRKGNVLRIEFSRSGGWCGWYTLLNGIDVSKHNALSFWVKGEKGGERFDIGLADDKMQDLQIDAVYAGPIMAFLPQGVTADWQQVKVPLAGLRSDIDMAHMGSLVLWFRYEGKGAIQIDDITFVNDPEVEEIQAANAPRAKADPRAPRFSWVWKYDPVNSEEIRKELITFCEKTAIGTVYVYLGEDPIIKTPQEYQDRLAQFLREAHAHNLQVEALQGNPLWALKANHPQVLKWVGGYLEFNRAHPKEERIDGVSLDIEPYLTSDWETSDREKLKAEFIELLAQCRELIDGETGQGNVIPAKAGIDPRFREDDKEKNRPWAVGLTAAKPFVMGVAIPVFYSREPEFEEALLKHVDYAALMDYYDTGTDIIENGRFHIDLANHLGKKMIVGVETQDLVQMSQGKRRNTFHEEGWEDMEQQLGKVVDTFADNPGFGGVAIHCYDSYRLLQKGRNVPTRERSGKVPGLTASQAKDPVAIDGDLADWKDAAWGAFNQRAQVLYGVGAWAGPHDLSFRMAFRWQPEALLIALDVTDNLIVQEKRGGDMWEGDHAEVWFDADLYADYSEAVNSSDDFQFGFSPGNFSTLLPEVHVWVPSVDPKSLSEIQIAAKKKEFGYTLELKIPAKVLFQAKKFQKGFRLGVMMDMSDCDETRQPQKCLLSSSPERQWGDPTTFNILELK